MAVRARRATLVQDLAATNPWWRSTTWQANDPQLRAAAQAPFTLEPRHLADIAAPNLYTFRGPRRTGKSTVLKQTIARLALQGIDPRRICFFAADTLNTSTEVINLFQAARQLFPDLADVHRYVFIDEVTAVRDWAKAIKWLRDNTPVAGDCLVLTGSSARDVASGSEQLAGRRGPAAGLDRVLLPLSFPEFLRCAGYTTPASPRLALSDLYSAAGQNARDDALVYLDTLVGAFEAYLTVGGFPQAVAGFRLTGSVPDGFARDLWDVVQADLRAAGMMRAEQALRLLERVNASLTSRIGFRDVAQTLGVAHSTVGDWLSALADSFLILHLYQEAGGMPAIDRQRKIYPTDPFLARLPARLSESALIPDVTQLAEAALCITMFRAVQGVALDRLDAPSRLFYYRTQSGGEVDFLVPPGPLVAEAKYIDDPSERATRAMTANFDKGLLLTRSAYGDLPKVTIYPASVFAWLVNQAD